MSLRDTVTETISSQLRMGGHVAPSDLAAAVMDDINRHCFDLEMELQNAERENRRLTAELDRLKK